VAGSKNANGAGELEPEAAPRPDSQPSALASAADILTGEAAGEHVDPRQGLIDISDVGDDGESGFVALDDGAAVLVGFARPRDSVAGELESEVEAAAACEQRPNGHACPASHVPLEPRSSGSLRTPLSPVILSPYQPDGPEFQGC
jgi:hypothetical protein